MSTTASKPSLMDLIVAIAASDLTDIQKRDRTSAVKTVAKAFGLALADIPLETKLLRRKLEEVSPQAVGLSKARWNNVRSLFNRALELKLTVMSSRQTVAVSPAWASLSDALVRARRYKILPLLRFLSQQGIEPDAVCLGDLEAFKSQILEHRLRANPETTWDGVIWAWNKSRQDVANWPQIVLSRPDRRKVYVQPWSDFPASLKADVDGYLRRLSGVEIDEEGPTRAARPSTLKNREYQARGAASALVAEGVAIETLKSLADIANLAAIKIILTHVRDRSEGEHAGAASNMANFLKAVAQHWVKVDDAELVKIRRVCAKVAIRQKGMTPKNRKRLQPFNDPAFVRDFYDLPNRMVRDLKTRTRKTIPDAITAQVAVAIAIVQAIPMRVRNLANLDLSKHFIDQAGKVYICIQENEVKNASLIHMQLPSDVADLVAWYYKTYHGLLTDAPTSALFPGPTGAPKQEASLSRQISEKLMQYLGIEMNTHLFRHAAGKIYLDRNPGDYATVSRILGHKSLATTLAIYTGAETVTAGQHFQAMIGELRGAR